MAFNGSLIMVGSFAIPLQYILVGTYKVTLNVLELEAYNDSNGVLHRETLDHVKGKIEFEMPKMTNSELGALFRSIEGNYTVAKERKAIVTFYVPEKDDYITQEMYMPSIDYEMELADAAQNIVYYNSIRMAFIGY